MLYGVTVLLMLALQRHHNEQHAGTDVADVLEADYHTVLRHRADCPLAAIAYCKTMSCWRWRRLAITAGARRGLAKDKTSPSLSIAYAADPVVAAITSSVQTQTIPRLASLKINLLSNISKVADRVYPRRVLQPDRHIFHRRT